MLVSGRSDWCLRLWTLRVLKSLLLLLWLLLLRSLAWIWRITS